MPNRMLRDWTDSDKVNTLSVHAERFFTRLIMKVDDYGCFYANTSLLKANLFPLLLDAIREADISRWTAECEKAGLIVLYEANGKKYLQILDFRQRLDKAKAKYPLPPIAGEPAPTGGNFPEVVNDFPAESETESELEENRANALGATAAGSEKENLKKCYDDLLLELKGQKMSDVKPRLETFIEEKRPDFIEPYVDLWRIVATKHKLPLADIVNEARRKKFKTRIAEKEFEFVKIMNKISHSQKLKGTADGRSDWKVTFDWVFENSTNYVKILEGNYD